jgi:hypothetical protein
MEVLQRIFSVLDKIGKIPVRCTGKQKTQTLERIIYDYTFHMFHQSTIDEGGHVFFYSLQTWLILRRWVYEIAALSTYNIAELVRHRPYFNLNLVHVPSPQFNSTTCYDGDLPEQRSMLKKSRNWAQRSNTIIVLSRVQNNYINKYDWESHNKFHRTNVSSVK